MDTEWLTYREAANRLGSNIEAVRQRAIRCRWPRMLGNDKRARIQIPEGLTNPLREGNDRGSREGSDRLPRGTNERAYEAHLIKVLEAHVETLKEQLAAAEERADKNAADLTAEQARTSEAIAAFSALAERLEALAQARRPWWRRLVG